MYIHILYTYKTYTYYIYVEYLGLFEVPIYHDVLVREALIKNVPTFSHVPIEHGFSFKLIISSLNGYMVCMYYTVSLEIIFVL